MAGFTDYGTHGMLDTPGGSVLLRPDQYAQFGIAPPPVLDKPAQPPIDPAAGIAPPVDVPMFAPPDSPVPVGALDAPAPAPVGMSVAAPSALPVQVDPAAVTSQAPKGHGVDAPLAQAQQEQPSAPRGSPNLSTTTYGDTFAAGRDAIEQGAAADAEILRAQTENNEAKAQAAEQRNAAISAAQAKFAAEEAKQQQEIADTTARYSDAVKQFAEAKVDRSNYKVSGTQWLGVALSGLGSAIKGDGSKNPALDYLQQQIDQYVDDEYRKKDALGQNVGMVKDQLGVLRASATNTQAQKQLAVAGIMDRHLRDLDAMIPRMENKQAAGELMKVRAAGAERVAGLLGSAVQLQHGEDQQKAQREQQERESRRAAATAAANRREGARQFDLSLAEQIAAREQSKAAAVAAATNEIDKENIKREVADLKMAARNPDGSVAESLYRAKNEKQGDAVAEMHASVKTLDNLMAEAERLRAAYPNFAALRKTPEYQRLQANISAAGIAWAKANQMGAWDNGTAKAVLGAQGGDPMREGYLSDTIGRYLQGDARVGLEQFRKNTVLKFNDFAQSVRDPRGGDYVPIEPQPVNFGTDPIKRKTDETVDAILADKTPEEIRAGAAPNKLQRGLGYVASALDTPGTRQRTNQEGRAELEIDRVADLTGAITKRQASSIADLGMLAASDKGDKSAAARAALEGIALKGDRPALAQRALETLAKIGDEEALQRVESALVSTARSEREQDIARRPVAIARAAEADRVAANDPNARKTPAVADLAGLAARGDAGATEMLANLATGKPATRYGKPPTGDERYDALLAVQALKRKRGGK